MIDYPGDPLPSWVTSIRPQQQMAVEQIMAAFDRGVDVVVLDAPTGSGKTLIAELVRRELAAKSGTYVAHSISLQEQFLKDFPYAKVLKGRGNYKTMLRRDLTAADCGKGKCQWCDPRSACAYTVAKREAVRSDVAVLNTSYMLTFQVPLFVRDFVVVDECDTLESCMLGYYEFSVSGMRLRQLGIKAPVKGARTPTIIRWLGEELLPAANRSLAMLQEHVDDLGDELAAQEEGLMRKLEGAKSLVERAELLRGQLEAGETPWVREYGSPGEFIMRPVEVSRQGAEVLWSRGKGRGNNKPDTKWLCMSGTVIDPQEWARSTGIIEAGLTWDLVTVPMLWAKENRPIVGRTWGDMSRSAPEGDKAKVLGKIVEICQVHEGENVLVHAVSRALCEDIRGVLEDAGISALTYGPKDREKVLRKFKSHGGVIVAPSLDRGVDLPDDLCRVQIIAKMPFLNLGDRQVSERLKTPGGDLWYQVQTARTLVQMTGRGVRHKDDRCVTYILDAAFDRYYRKWARLLPRWWRDSIVGELPGDWFRGSKHPRKG